MNAVASGLPGDQRVCAPRAALVLFLLVFALLSVASAQYSYDVERYHRYVSVGSWWPHATTTNNTASLITWRVSYSIQRCRSWSGAVSLARQASSNLGRNSCSTASFTASTTLPAYTSAALMGRSITHYNYYAIRKFDSLSGRLVDSGHTTERDTFQEYTFSAHY